MCVVSMVGDHFTERWKDLIPQQLVNWPGQSATITQPQISREEFDKLKAEVELLKGLLKRAKQYDIDNNEPSCEIEEKVVLLRKIAELVGVDLNEVL